MVLNNVTEFHKILIKNIRARERTSLKTAVNFHKQRAITTESLVRYGPLSNLKKTLNFHKQRAITTESLVRYGPLSNLKKTLWY